MTLKQALRVAARESKTVRRSLIDKLEQQSRPQSANEIIAAMALANVAQERRLKSIEHQVGLRRNGLSDAKCRQLVMAWNIPYKKVPHVVPGGPITQMSVVDEDAFKNALDKMMLRAEKRGSQGYHPKMGRFSVTA